METNAKLSMTNYNNITEKEHPGIVDIGIHPIHDAAKRDAGYSMAKNIAKEECGHNDFEIIAYKVRS